MGYGIKFIALFSFDFLQNNFKKKSFYGYATSLQSVSQLSGFSLFCIKKEVAPKLKTIKIMGNHTFGYLKVNFRLLAKKLTRFVGELHG